MRYFAILLVCLGLLSGCSATPLNKIVTVGIKGKTITCEVALTARQQYKGLSDRASLPEDRGMLFLFAEPGDHKFVMRRMNFPLDIVWIKGDKIIYIAKNLPPEGAVTANVYGPDDNADKVLEVNAGLAERYNWQIGQSIIVE